jgi:cysteine desulfurase/selenocysteine lyase
MRDTTIMDIATIRQHFPGLEDKVFLDAACVSLAPRDAADAVTAFARMALACDERSSTLHHIAMDRMRDEARVRVARLINAREDEIALVESTSHGLSIAADAIPLVRGDRVLLGDLEFLEVAVPWVQKRERTGIEIDVVPNRGGMILAEDIASHIRPETRVVAISSVQWSNGFRSDLDAISGICRERGVWLVTDAIQQLGAIPIDVQKTPVDVLACGGHKWLNAPFGLGFLYIRREAMPGMTPPLGGYLSLEPPAGGWGAYFQTPSITPVGPCAFTNEARRFEIGGTANYPGAAGLAASLDLIEQVGGDRIAAAVRQLTDHLIEGLQALHVTVVTPVDPRYRSGIVTFGAGSPDADVALMEFLLDRRILVSVRYTSHVGGVRVSCHFFNSIDDVDRLLNAVEEYQRGRRPAR